MTLSKSGPWLFLSLLFLLLLQSLRVMISRLESLVRQQREQGEAYRQASPQEGSRPRWFHTSFTWTRGDGNSGSDSGLYNSIIISMLVFPVPHPSASHHYIFCTFLQGETKFVNITK